MGLNPTLNTALVSMTFVYDQNLTDGEKSNTWVHFSFCHLIHLEELQSNAAMLTTYCQG